MAKRYTKEYRQQVIERLKRSESVVALAKETGVHRRLLYKWREQLEACDQEDGPPESSREARLRNEVNRLKRVLADKTLEADFFKGALQKVEARRPRNDARGEQASTTRSGK